MSYSLHTIGSGLFITMLSFGCADSTADAKANVGVGGSRQRDDVAATDKAVGGGGMDSNVSAGGANSLVASDDAKHAPSAAGAKADSVGGAGNVSAGGSAPLASGGSTPSYHEVSGGARSTIHELGFEIRSPRSHEMDCLYNRDPKQPMRRDVPERDWLCTFKHGAVSGHVYVQATPVKCNMMIGALTPEYESRGWIEVDGVVSELRDAAYSWGEVHHVDSVSFVLNDLKYTYRHSTMMYGRPCQPMDCLSVTTLANEVVDDGCTEERNLPVTCVSISEDGTKPDLTDHFKRCDQETLCTSTGGTVERSNCRISAWTNTCLNPIENCEPDPDRDDQPYCRCPTGSCFEPLEYEPYEWNGCINPNSP